MDDGRRNNVMRVYIDMEGEPVQELAAICVKEKDWCIYSVFHMYAATSPIYDVDWYSRRYVHGLSLSMLDYHGERTEKDLRHKFDIWLDSLPCEYDYYFYANDPRKECHLLSNFYIDDVYLPPWKERAFLPSHLSALDAKRQCLSLCGKKCGAWMHASYSHRHRSQQCSSSSSPPSSTQLAKLAYGYHCALYDALECYLFQKEKNCINKND